MEKVYRKHALKTSVISPFKACVCYFLTIFYFSPNDSPSRSMKDVFISSKNLFLFSKCSNICTSIFPSFSPCKDCFRAWFKIILKVYNVINCLNKNLKLLSAIFYKIFIFHQMIALQELLKNVFLFHLKSSFRSCVIFKFLYFRLPLFFSLSAIALEDVRR